MDIVLNRKGGIPVRDQLVAQLEMRILGGAIPSGERLPSVRTLARRLRVHANTVSAAYRRLEATGHVEMRKGAGVFVRAASGAGLSSARDLDEMIALAIDEATRQGYRVAQIRAAVKRWLDSTPPVRFVTVDPSLSMAELLRAEVLPVASLPVEARALDAVARAPESLEGAVAVSLPYHVAALRRAAPRTTVLEVNLEIPAGVPQALKKVPGGAIALVISHADTVLPFSKTLLKSLRDDDLLVETRLLSDGRGWRRLLPAADVVFADVLSADTVAQVRPRGLVCFRLLSDAVLERIAAAARAAPEGEAKAVASQRGKRRRG
jgi:GntR family transcriptional regulator